MLARHARIMGQTAGSRYDTLSRYGLTLVIGATHGMADHSGIWKVEHLRDRPIRGHTARGDLPDNIENKTNGGVISPPRRTHRNKTCLSGAFLFFGLRHTLLMLG